MGDTRCEYGRDENCIQNFCGKLDADHLENASVDLRVIQEDL